MFYLKMGGKTLVPGIPHFLSPEIKLASALYLASDNMFDRLVDGWWMAGLKTQSWGFIFRFYNCPCSSTMYTSKSSRFSYVVPCCALEMHGVCFFYLRTRIYIHVSTHSHPHTHIHMHTYTYTHIHSLCCRTLDLL